MKRLMTKLREFLGLLYVPNLATKIILGIIPFVVLGAVYSSAMQERKAKNPDDRMLPSVHQMYSEVAKYVTDRDMRTRELTFAVDTLSSLKRVCYGVLVGATAALFIGLFVGVFPWFRVMMMPIVVFFSNIIPPSIIAILMIVFGSDEFFKIAFISFGIMFLMIRDVSATVQGLPEEQKIKLLTLGGKSFSYIVFIVVPQILPRFINTIRVYLGPAWVYVLTTEMLKAENGLAYRILLVKRSMNMPLIIPIVLWITLIASMIVVLLGAINKKLFPWYGKEKK